MQSPEKRKVRNEYFEKLIKDGFIVFSNLRRAALAFLALQNFSKQLNKFYGNMI